MKLRLHPLYFILLCVFVILGMGKEFFIYFFVVLFHEFFHYIVAKRKGYTLDKLYLLPFGACLDYKNQYFKSKDEIEIAIAGPLSNLVLCIFLICLWWIEPVTYIYTEFLCLASFVTFVFNLLPCFPLDGGRILLSFLKEKTKEKTAINIICFINIIFSAIFVILFIISIFIKINLTYLMVAILIFSGCIDSKFESKYSLILKNNIGNKAYKKGVTVQFIAISSDTPLYKLFKEVKNKKLIYFHIVYPNKEIKIINQFNLEKIINNYSFDTKIGEILEK